MTKLWNKGIELNNNIENYTVGNDYIIDKKLVKYDCIASIAHSKILCSIGVLTEEEKDLLILKLAEIIKLSNEDNFVIEKSDEDCHTAIENYLVLKLGDLGKKIHTCRSRNDQIITALRLFEKDELQKIKESVENLTSCISKLSNKYEDLVIPGYTHMQKAMPNKISELLGSYIASFHDDLVLLETIYNIIDQNPLGSAAGFGVPVFEVNKSLTAKEMNFSKVMNNSNYAQLSRGKFEGSILHLCSQIMFTLNKMSSDFIMFNMSEFGFVKLKEEFLTGSSIMPNKNNPDILELVRANYHILLGEEFKVKSLIANLISGYNRDLQLTKEPVMKSIKLCFDSIYIMSEVVSNLEFNVQKCNDALSPEIYATEMAYELVKNGMTFRDAYKEVAKKIKNN